MSGKAKTKDERYLVALYEMATQRGNQFHAVHRDLVGERVGIQPKGVNAICNLLLQANFIRKKGPVDVFLTPNGLSLVQSLLDV